MPTELAVGVPESSAVPFDLAVKVMPAGSVPVREIVGVGVPATSTWKLNSRVAVAVAVAALMNRSPPVVLPPVIVKVNG